MATSSAEWAVGLRELRRRVEREGLHDVPGIEADYSLEHVRQLRGGIGLAAVFTVFRAVRQIWAGTSPGHWVTLTFRDPARGAIRFKVDDGLEIAETGSCSVIGSVRAGGAMAMVVDGEVVWPLSVPSTS